MHSIPVFFSCDNNYLPFLAVSIRSLIDNLDPNAACDIHILNTGLDRASVRDILNMATDRVSIRTVDVSNQLKPIADQLALRDYYTASIYFRLFIPSLFPQYRKVIYLDADIVVNSDISKLYSVALGTRLVAAASDEVIASCKNFRRYAEEGLGIPHRRYFNSGVLVMNLDQFRHQKIEEKFIHLLTTYQFDTVCPDQDYLNMLCRNRVLYLDQGWNKMSVNEDYNGIPMLVHYNMFYKPWLYRNIPYSDLFWHYAARTPYHTRLCEILRSFGFKGKLKHWIAKHRLHQSVNRICRSSKNFRRVLTGEISLPAARSEEHHA